MNRKLQYTILAADLLWISTALVLAQALRTAGPQGATGLSHLVDLPAIIAASAIWIVLYFRRKLEGFRGGWYFPSVFAQVVVGVFYLIGCLLAFAFLVNYHYPWPALLYLGCLLAAGFIGIRCLSWWLAITRSGVRARRRVMILAADGWCASWRSRYCVILKCQWKSPVCYFRRVRSLPGKFPAR